MSIATVSTRAIIDINARAVTVEVHLVAGLPSFSIVGLPEAAVRESRDRVRSAIINSGFEFPRKRITVNLAPADLPKVGAGFDLAIAVGVLVASGTLESHLIDKMVFLGELALNGGCRPVRGALIAALSTKTSGLTLVVADGNYDEASMCEDCSILPIESLLQLIEHLTCRTIIQSPAMQRSERVVRYADLKDVKGQVLAKSALEIAAAGFHNILLVGPPGTGKSMLSSRLPGIMPRMTMMESIQSAAVRSLSNEGFSAESWHQRPYRSPHHSASGAALIGGGSVPKPGEISLAHNGVLFLDELPEFDRRVLELLREPMETGEVHISRAAHQTTFPAQFLMIAACNPCPCGYAPDYERCRCTVEQIRRYRGKLSGPLLDRVDIVVDVPEIPLSELRSAPVHTEGSECIRQRVGAAVDRQFERQGCYNSRIESSNPESDFRFAQSAKAALPDVVAKLKLSARGFHRLLRVSRTVADLANSDDVTMRHISHALSLRHENRFEI